MAGFYAAYHGAEGLKKIATRVLRYRQTLLLALKWCGLEVDESEGFDTVRFKGKKTIQDFNVRYEDGWTILSLDENVLSIQALHDDEINNPSAFGHSQIIVSPYLIHLEHTLL